MRHRKKGRKLNRSSSHRKALCQNILKSLFTYGKIITTTAKAKEFAREADKIITIAKRAEQKVKEAEEKIKEKANQEITPDVETELLKQSEAIRVSAYRQVFTKLRDKKIVQRIFFDIRPLFDERQGGYTRVLKLNKRRVNDDAPLAIIELVEELPPEQEREKTAEDKKAAKDKKKKIKDEVKRKRKERKEKEKEKERLKKEKDKERLKKEREKKKKK